MTAQYTVASLEELAAAFEQFASDEDGCSRTQISKSGEEHCRVAAIVWRQAASILRNTTIQGAPHDAG